MQSGQSVHTCNSAAFPDHVFLTQPHHCIHGSIFVAGDARGTVTLNEFCQDDGKGTNRISAGIVQTGQ